MIDDIDRQIIRILQRDGRMSHRDLGREIGLSANATGVRVNRLLQRGVITGVHARVDHAAMGRPIEVDIDCRLREPDERSPMEAVAAADDRILDAYHITGRVDFRLRAVVGDPNDLDDLLTRLRNEGGVAETDSRLILHRLATAHD